MIEALDHVQVAMPAGKEDVARGFYSGLPDGRQLHPGVEEPFGASRKAHPAFAVSSLDALAGSMEAVGFAVRWDGELAPRRRFCGEDPFGNRLEFPGAWLSGAALAGMWRDIMGEVSTVCGGL